jgi:hypothetical protein
MHDTGVGGNLDSAQQNLCCVTSLSTYTNAWMRSGIFSALSTRRSELCLSRRMTYDVVRKGGLC